MSTLQNSDYVTMVCTKCGHIEHGDVQMEVFSDDFMLATADLKIVAECQECGGYMEETDSAFAEAISNLIKKGYLVHGADSCRFSDELYAPYIKIASVGLEDIGKPVGWRNVTHESVQSFIVFSPIGTYGTADNSADVDEYVIATMFQTKEEFEAARDRYTRQLEQWVNKLPFNTTLGTLKNLRSENNVIDV